MSASGPRKDFDFIPISQRLRYDPKRPFPEFGIGRILLFAFACTFGTSFMRLYCQYIVHFYDHSCSKSVLLSNIAMCVWES